MADENADQDPERDDEGIDLSEEEVEEIQEKMEDKRESRQYKLEIPNIFVAVENEPDIEFRNESSELVRGVENTLTLRFENIGENDFPGGELTQIEITSGMSGGVEYDGRVEIPEIPVGETRDAEVTIDIYSEGMCGIQARIELDGRGTVELDGSGNNTLSKALLSIPRENLRIISELEEIKNALVQDT